jgi:hypothetical protein
MNIPRFTAEVSLYKLRHSCRADRSIEIVKPAFLSGAVEPAFLIRQRHTDFCTLCEDAGGVCIHTPFGDFCM